MEKYTVEWDNGTILIYESTEGSKTLIKSFLFPQEKEEYKKWALSVPPGDITYIAPKDFNINEAINNLKTKFNNINNNIN